MFNLCCSRTNRFGVKGILLSLNVLLMSTVLTSDNSSKYIPRFKFLLSNTSAKPEVAGMTTARARIESVESVNLYSLDGVSSW